MSNELAARMQTGISLGFHIIFAVLGVGLPLLLLIAEGLGLRYRDATWYTLARRWSKAFAILFVTGAVSGTVLSFEFGLLWPRFMGFSTAVIGLPFALEGFMFFLEAIFLGLYLYGWDRLSPLAHWLCSIPIAVAGAASTWFIVTVNSWMNTPAGFTLVNGKPANIDPIAAMLNPSTPFETTHMLLAAFEATGFGVAAVYALFLLWGRRDAYIVRGMRLGLIVGSVVAPFQILVGDLSARGVAETQPAKLAAMEALFQTTKGAALHIYGWPDVAQRKLIGPVEIPKLLSWLVTGDPNATVQGLDATPVADWPAVTVVHFAFDTMVGIGFFLAFVAALYWGQYLYRRLVRKQRDAGPLNRLTLLCVLVSGPLTFVAIELGWITTEIGRQPWIIYNVMRISEAPTSAPGVVAFFVTFLVVYVALFTAAALLLSRMARSGPAGDQEEAEREALTV
ncbi:MAG TPA: cytochrome ubiquinol oxidase subunit I [Ktedonobacterales bacterium]|nr:cytochrome ubiquinol oxidase subunit I [Ktedonobacterales bacterium]